MSALVFPGGDGERALQRVNRTLECALDAGAELIVTGDKQILALGDLEGVRIVRLREYLASS